MWLNIINKMINNEKLSKEEEKEFSVFQKRFFTEESREAVVVVLSNIKKGYARDFLERISQDTKDEQDKQIKYYLIGSISQESLKFLKKTQKTTETEVSIIKKRKNGEEYEDEQVLRQENDTELSYYSKNMREAAEKAFDEAVEYVQKKDGRKGELKLINFDTNKHLITEGNLGRNFALFLPWRESILENRSDYTIEKYIEYVKKRTAGELILNKSSEDDRVKKIWKSTSSSLGSITDGNPSSKDVKTFCCLFRLLSAMKFFKRKPEILKEISFEEYVTRYLSDEVLK